MAMAPELDSHSHVLMRPGLKGRQTFTKPFQDALDIDDEYEMNMTLNMKMFSSEDSLDDNSIGQVEQV